MTAIIRTSPRRSLTLWERWHRPFRLLEDLERMGDELGESGPVTLQTSFMPRLEMYEKKDELVVRTELPGVRKEDLDISITGDMLTIKAEKKQEEVSEETNYYLCERCFGHYSRSVSLPFPVDTNKISSTFENGLLEIRLPKSEEAKPKQIEVKVK